jgi:hypothetical protein
MDENRPHEFFGDVAIPFVPGTGYVGMGTVPGAPAQPVVALVIEAEVDTYDGKPMESIWLKARLHGKEPGKQGDCEYLMFATDARELEPVIAAIAEVAMGRPQPGSGRIAGSFSGYHNQAQIAADETVTEECREGLSAEVRRGLGGRGVELALRDDGQRDAFEKHSRAFATGGADRAVARLNAELDPAAVTTLLSEFARLREWQEGMRRKVEAYVEAEASPPAPGF